MAVGAPHLTLLELSEQLIAGSYQSGNSSNIGSSLNVIEFQDSYVCNAAIHAGMTLQILPDQHALFNALFRARCDGPCLIQLLMSFVMEALILAFIFRADVGHEFSESFLGLYIWRSAVARNLALLPALRTPMTPIARVRSEFMIPTARPSIALCCPHSSDGSSNDTFSRFTARAFPSKAAAAVYMTPLSQRGPTSSRHQ